MGLSFERSDDRASLDLGELAANICGRADGPDLVTSVVEFVGEIRPGDRLAAQHESALDRVAQLANVAWPAVAGERLACFLAEDRDAATLGGCGDPSEV